MFQLHKLQNVDRVSVLQISTMLYWYNLKGKATPV